MKVIVTGACGRMGKQVLKKVKQGVKGAVLAAAIEKNMTPDADVACYENIEDYKGEADVIIDFSHHSAATEICEYAQEKKIPVVFATTGFTSQETAQIHRLSETVPVFLSANMSLGVALLTALVKKAAVFMDDADIEIVETHHNKKLDAPSGTALMLADAIRSQRQESEYVFGRHGQHQREKKEIGIHALRLGNVVGEHEIIFNTGNETLTLKHQAHDRALFADGALAAAVFIIGQTPGLYDMSHLLEV